jgi:hypothetical protein
MRRFVLCVSLFATVLCCQSTTRAQAGSGIYPGVACQALPFGYPRGWELMVRRPCLIYYGYTPYYDAPRYYPLANRYVGDRIYRRPYLRPGWWW